MGLMYAEFEEERKNYKVLILLLQYAVRFKQLERLLFVI